MLGFHFFASSTNKAPNNVISSLLFVLVCGILKNEVMTMTENKLADMSMDFAIRILRMIDSITGHYALKN